MLKRFSVILLALYTILSALSLFILILGWRYPQYLVGTSTIAGFGFSLLYCADSRGWKHTFRLLLISFTVSLAMESVGVATGAIYGPYHYTDQLGPKFLGLVPYLIPLAWFMMMYPSLVIAGWLLRIIKSKIWKIIGISALGGLIMTCWDLVMDPVMVLGGHWVWDGPLSSRVYFGIPQQNYLGWWLTTFLVFLVYQFVSKPLDKGVVADEIKLPAISYSVTGLSSVISAFIAGLIGPAIVGLIAMLPWMITGLFIASRPKPDRLKTTWF